MEEKIEIGNEEYINEIIGRFQNVLCECLEGCCLGFIAQESILDEVEIGDRKCQITIKVNTDMDDFI